MTQGDKQMSDSRDECDLTALFRPIAHLLKQVETSTWVNSTGLIAQLSIGFAGGATDADVENLRAFARALRTMAPKPEVYDADQ
jgi:hypothetical protein